MDTSTKKPQMHLGRKVGRMRELLGIKQETLATELGISQQAVSKLEQSDKIEDERLEEVAKILGVSAEAIKNFDEDKIINNINYMYDSSSVETQTIIHTQINPIKELVELYERLLQSEREKVSMLEKLLGEKSK